jgi:enterobacteria phage integrase
MTSLRLKYVNEYVDRWGKVRRYFRKGGRNLGPLPGAVGSEEFMAAYAAYLAEQPGAATARPLHADSLAKLITDFYGDAMFTKRKPSTRQLYRYALEPVTKEHGHRSVRLMTSDHAEKIIQKIGERRPGMANLTLAVTRRVMQLAVKRKLRGDNPFAGVEPYKGGEHHTWTDAELRQFETKWHLGTRQRVAYALLLYTGQRVGDVAKMNRADVSAGLIHVVQQKTGTELWVPMHVELQRALKAFPAKGLTLIGDAAGRPIKRAALSALMRAAIKDAGLPPRCVAHGLRKANQRLIAEHGGTGKQLASVAGHKTLKETERYTKAADQIKLAREAISKLKVPNSKGKNA